MKLKDFDYDLPKELIAYYPAEKRTDSRLLMVDNGDIQHKKFSDILDLLHEGDCLVLNDTKVMPARLFGKKASGGKIEVLIERVIDSHHVLAHVRSSKAPKEGAELTCEDIIFFNVEGRDGSLFKLKLENEETIFELLESHGRMPLPPYIEREATSEDKDRYQTVYAKDLGSVAAPTAGLHFDEELLEKVKAKGISITYLTLHVGAGTFQPVRAENIEDHDIHSEYIIVSKEVCDVVKKTKASGGRVITVGTTSTRALESAAQDGELKPFAGETNLYIYPGYEYKLVDALITNFHLPESSLLMLVSAFIGYEEMKHVYEIAVKEKYRFYSYGDASFLVRKKHEI